ncbi:uncharacterized protein LOC134283838 [Saccostrea cucullata]|uniref:uncharacterized protein LOC134283838 n=1 Tax=Saccostrea cuccullata TaxID=36930 RepID=UPI002ED1FFD6
MSEKSMHAVLDFGAEAVKNVDAKLAILRFDYSWAAEVEREERIMEEVEKQPLEITDVVRQLKSDEDKTIHRQLILDFGKEAVKNIDEKLDILKFNYNWVDEVEREERKAEKASKKPLEHTDTMKQKQWMSDEDYKTFMGNFPL